METETENEEKDPDMDVNEEKLNGEPDKNSLIEDIDADEDEDIS